MSRKVFNKNQAIYFFSSYFFIFTFLFSKSDVAVANNNVNNMSIRASKVFKIFPVRYYKFNSDLALGGMLANYVKCYNHFKINVINQISK